MAVDHHDRVYLGGGTTLPEGHYSLHADKYDRQPEPDTERATSESPDERYSTETPTGHSVVDPRLVEYKGVEL